MSEYLRILSYQATRLESLFPLLDAPEFAIDDVNHLLPLLFARSILNVLVGSMLVIDHRSVVRPVFKR